MGEGDTLVNAAIGALVSVILSFLPFAAILGGALAGFLQRRDVSGGAKVGALSGFLAAIPILLLLAVLGAFVPFTPAELAVPSSIVLVVLFVVVVGYFVGASALGGAIGGYLARRSGA